MSSSSTGRLYKLPDVATRDPSPLAQETNYFDDGEFFAAALFQPVVDGTCKYIPLGTDRNMFRTDSLIIRPCYDHLLPQIHNCMRAKKGYTTAVTGTPGIGKSVFGVLLVRHYVERKQTVLYWEKDNIYLFSFDLQAKRFFGLSDFYKMDDGATCFAGCWDTAEAAHWPRVFTRLFDIVYIHDPKAEDTRVHNRNSGKLRLIYILSHGHYLVSHWLTKGIGPDRHFYMPLWSKSEARRSWPVLQRQGGLDTSFHSLDEVESLYDLFGGCIRGWVLQDAVWRELEAKVREVAKKQGDDVLVKNMSTRGSVIHMLVEFDESKPIAMFEDAENMSADQPGGDENEVGELNDFSKYHYIFGSAKIVEKFVVELLNISNEALKLCLKNWAGHSGFESVYGALFELRCHRQLENNTGQLKLKMRVVFHDETRNTDETRDVVFPALTGTVRYKSNDPSVLEEKMHDGAVEKCKYLWPYSSNHPSYDSAVVVDGEILGLDGKIAALLLQMTVSGATGLPRRPEHAVKQHVRKKFEHVFKERIPDYKRKGVAVTAFMVPTECFEQFLFQEETTMKNDDTKTEAQPDFQLVFEVPDIFTYKRSSPKSWNNLQRFPDFDFESRKRCHKYSDVPVSAKREKLVPSTEARLR